MSQAAVERILGKLITDDAFRARFFADPAVASFAAGIALSDAEVDALSRLPKKALARLSKLVDDRICRVTVDEE